MILEKDGLSLELLESLSYRSRLGKSLKNSLRHFDKSQLFEEIENILYWYDDHESLHSIISDYRLKSTQSCLIKYDKFYPEMQHAKVFNDILGFRMVCDNYEDVLKLSNIDKRIRIVDMSIGKKKDDGYKGVHVYFQIDNFHYPIEIQYNTFYDRQINNWLHKYIYKRGYPNNIGCNLRKLYENGNIKDEKEFKEVLTNVLSSSEEI